MEDEIKKGLISRLKRHCTNKGESKDREVQKLVEKRNLVQIKSDFYKKIIAESAMQMNMDKLNNAIKFDADDEIEYIPLGYNEYRVILPLKMCIRDRICPRQRKVMQAVTKRQVTSKVILTLE